ncbi:MFS transporter [Pseudoduganella namucuonensis]|uniref:MFS transporter, AAHS family, 4-hydroxybenzoate transporter n=1 Tax=Pseudoduganella namucuonensis TaxID=1035707 RepID=A0A1I7LHI5_9BURK|nr:MFS transporter [Pseudoduganella namucuonensis]SFV09165.1 MFS transporter, AAHS family, 4-hydroxybenzoate transporter [Pseudoduganella namucuonensis]
MSGQQTINVSDIVDNGKLGPFHFLLLSLCGWCLIMDGFDVQAMGYVAPALIADWGIAKTSLGPVFGAGLFGMLVGSLIFGVLADKIGRRPVLIGSTVFFGACMVVTAHAGTIQELLVLRFITGLGLGSIIPNAIAIAGEYSPTRIRVRTMMIISAGFIVGAALGGFVSAAIIPYFGWRSVFYVGGVIPLLLAVVMFFVLPESLQFLVMRGNRGDRIAAILKRIDAAFVADAGTRYVVSEQPKKGALVAQLFREGRARATILIWIVSFMNLLVLFFLSNWLPVLMKDAGFSTNYAVLAGTALQVGGIAGTLTLGWCIDRAGFGKVLIPTFVAAATAIVMIGQVHTSLPLVFATIFIAGFCIVGGQPAINALAATYYPTSLRSTGIGWSVGIGRLGSIVGPVVGGELLRLEWSMSALFMAAAVPAAIAALTTMSMRGPHGKAAAVAAAG